MKKLAVSLGRMLFVLLLLVGLSVCTLSDQTESPPPEDALSFDQLLANLDELQGPAMQSPSAPGRSVFSLPDGSLFSSADLSAYINAIKKDLAGYIYSCTGGAPYLVVPKRVTWTTADGDTESGLIWVPFTWNPWKKFPVIAYQHGTQVAWECAPSCFNPNPLAILWARDLTGALQAYVECIVGGLMASAGYIVAMPDYAGFGSSTDMHPYVHLSLGDSVARIVGEARSRYKANRKVYLTGYSEGGYTTMAGARALQPQHLAGQIDIRAIVPCDGPYSLSGVMLTEMTTPEKLVKVPSYLLYAASGYNAVYGDTAVDLYALLTDYWASVVDGGLFSGDYTNAQVSAVVPASVPPESMLDPDTAPALLAPPPEGQEFGGDVYELLKANNAWQWWVPTSPLVFVHCREDDVVPIANAEAAQLYYWETFQAEVPIVEVPAIPFIESVLGSKHVAAYPTAMLAAFTIIMKTP